MGSATGLVASSDEGAASPLALSSVVASAAAGSLATSSLVSLSRAGRLASGPSEGPDGDDGSSSGRLAEGTEASWGDCGSAIVIVQVFGEVEDVDDRGIVLLVKAALESWLYFLPICLDVHE